MGGVIGVESHPGQGSTFWFEIRLERQLKPERLALAPTRVFRGLIVDDRTNSRRVQRAGLEALGGTCVEAVDEEQALALVASAPPFDVALLDYQLPGADPERLLAELKRGGVRHVIVLLPLTSFAEARRLEASGAARCLIKPIKHRVLSAAVCSVLDGASAPEALHSPRSALPAPPLVAIPALAILVVEDNLVNQKIATRMLQKLGQASDLAVNGLEAIERMHAKHYDLVLMDCQMPEMDGFEATESIRVSERGGNVHRWIVAMTANAMQGDREHCLASGMDDYVAKPIGLASLQAVLQTAAARAAVSAAAPTSPPPG
jgi:CheY-like chemotaxis protein